jgi:transposase
MKSKGMSQREIARLMGVDEKSVRYHLGRLASGAHDGRADQELLLVTCGLAAVAGRWWEEKLSRLPATRQPSITQLHRHLQAGYGYPGSYKSVRKWVQATYPARPQQAFRRVETPPGAQGQVDWKEEVLIDINGPAGPERLQAFVLVLSHSRAAAVVWTRTRDELSWLHCHNEALRRLGGVPAVLRVDNCKTAIGTGSGPWGAVNKRYERYALSMRFHVDACRPRRPNEKGKVERVVRFLGDLGLFDKCYQSLEHLQRYTDEKLCLSQDHRICPATGETINTAWSAEKTRLQPLPAELPEPFDLVKTVQVHKDRMIHFEARQYEVPTAYVGRKVEARGCHGMVQIIDPGSGAVIRSYPRNTKERILLDPRNDDGPASDAVIPPPPLGRMAERLNAIQAMPPEQRPIGLYAAVAEVAR